MQVKQMTDRPLGQYLENDMKPFFLVLFSIIGFYARSQESYQIATIEYPPFYQDTQIDKGIACELVIEALKIEQKQVEFRFIPPMRMLLDINSNITLCGLGRDLQKDNIDIEVSDTIFNVQLSFLYDSRKHPNGIQFSQLSDLKNYTIGVLSKSKTEELLKSHQHTALISNTSTTGLAKQLVNNRIDLWATVDIAGLMLMDELLPNDKVYYKSTKPFQVSEINVVIPKRMDKDKELLNAINSGIKILKENGEYQKIIDKYLMNYPITFMNIE